MVAATLLSDVPVPTPSFAAIGDSITAGNIVGGTVAPWPTHLASITNWTLNNNAGISGSALSRGGSATDPMVDRWQTAITGEPGSVLLMGGVNDWHIGQPLGVPGSQDGGTIYGALYSIADGILSTHTSTTLYLMTPIWEGEQPADWRNTAGYTMGQVRQAVRDTAALMRERYGERAQLLETSPALDDWYSNGTQYMTSDALHPNAAGQLLLAQWISMHLRTASASVEVVAPAARAAYDMVQGNNAATVYDRIGTSNLTITGATWGATGLAFSGTSGQKAQGSVPAPSGAITLHVACTYTGGNTGSFIALNYGDQTSPSRLIAQGVESGQTWWATNTPGQDYLATAPAWPAVLSVQYIPSAGEIRHYINGVRIHAGASAALTLPNVLTIGNFPPGTLPWMGTVHYVRFDGALSDAQVQAIYKQIRTTLAARNLSLP